MLHNHKKIYYTLRIASAMCFIGHGSFGIITKQIWCNYFAVFGIGHDMAYTLMPWLGAIDVLIGISLLIYPVRIIVWWLVVWGIITALLRPLSGEPFAEFIERAGNFGAPLALLILCSNGRPLITGPFSLASPGQDVKPETLAQLTKYLRIVVFLLLVGHGWLNLIDKKGLLQQYTSIGFSNPVQVARVAGLFEIAAACMVLIRPLRPLIFILLLWKIGTELIYPQWELFEFIERGGSYGALLALWLALPGVPLRVRNTLVAS
jgi:uncharacterized membrane protein YphA (DoxX/SURF4 family)